jgi:hypothetical protein
VASPASVERGELSLYPNPAVDKIGIVPDFSIHDTDLLAHDAQLVVLDATGRVVLARSMKIDMLPPAPLMLDLSGLSNGRYILSLSMFGHTRAKLFSAPLTILR